MTVVVILLNYVQINLVASDLPTSLSGEYGMGTEGRPSPEGHGLEEAFQPCRLCPSP